MSQFMFHAWKGPLAKKTIISFNNTQFYKEINTVWVSELKRLFAK